MENSKDYTCACAHAQVHIGYMSLIIREVQMKTKMWHPDRKVLKTLKLSSTRGHREQQKLSYDGWSVNLYNLRNNTLASSRIAEGVLSALHAYTREEAGAGVGGKVPGTNKTQNILIYQTYLRIFYTMLEFAKIRNIPQIHQQDKR